MARLLQVLSFAGQRNHMQREATYIRHWLIPILIDSDLALLISDAREGASCSKLWHILSVQRELFHQPFIR